MNYFNFFSVLFFLFFAKFSFAQNEKTASQNAIAKPIFIKGTWQNLLDTAQAKKKMILVQCTAEWCLPCKQMEKYSFTDAAFAQFAANNLLCFRLDASGQWLLRFVAGVRGRGGGFGFQQERLV